MGRKPADQAEKRNDIILKTADLLKDRPFANITVRMICVAAGISIGTFYHYFGKKENVAAGIFRFTDEYIVGTLLPMLTGGDEIVNLVRFCTEVARFAEAQGVPYNRVLNSLPSGPDAGRVERKRPLFSELRKIVRRGIEKKQIDPSHDPDGLTDGLVLLLHGLDFDWVRCGGAYSLTERTRFFIAQVAVFLRCPRIDPFVYGE